MTPDTTLRQAAQRLIDNRNNWPPLTVDAKDFQALRAALGDGHQPGELHIWRIKCDVCDEKGTVILTIEPVFAPDEEDR